MTSYYLDSEGWFTSKTNEHIERHFQLSEEEACYFKSLTGNLRLDKDGYPLSGWQRLHVLFHEKFNGRDNDLNYWRKQGCPEDVLKKCFVMHLNSNRLDFRPSNLFLGPHKMNCWMIKQTPRRLQNLWMGRVQVGQKKKGFSAKTKKECSILSDRYKMAMIPTWGRNFFMKYGLQNPDAHSSVSSMIKGLKLKPCYTKKNVQKSSCWTIVEDEKDWHDDVKSELAVTAREIQLDYDPERDAVIQWNGPRVKFQFIGPRKFDDIPILEFLKGKCGRKVRGYVIFDDMMSHRVLKGVKRGDEFVCHVAYNKIDNRPEALQIGNSLNNRKREGGKEVKGFFFDRHRNRFVSRLRLLIMENGQKRSFKVRIGEFADEKDAREAYQKARMTVTEYEKSKPVEERSVVEFKNLLKQ